MLDNIPSTAGKHRGLLGPQLLGQQAPVLRPQELLHPGGLHRLPRRDLHHPALGGARYSNLSYFHEADKGGHFAAWEEPLLFASEMRAAFESLR